MNCYDKAVRLLSSRPHFRRQLEHKLVQSGYPPEEVRETLDRLAELGYLDDLRSARSFAEGRLRRGAMGRRRLRAELSRRGADEEVLERVVREAIPEDDLDLARSAAADWRRRGGGDRASLARSLDRRGFSQRAIVRLLEELAEGEDSA